MHIASQWSQSEEDIEVMPAKGDPRRKAMEVAERALPARDSGRRMDRDPMCSALL